MENFFSKKQNIKNSAEVKKKEQKTVLQKIRESKIAEGAIQGVSLVSIIPPAIELGVQIDNSVSERVQEIQEEIKKANEYLLEDRNKQDLSKFFNDDFISYVALSIKGKKNEDLYNLIQEKESLNSLLFDSEAKLDKTDSIVGVTRIKQTEKEIDNQKQLLSEEERKIAKENITEIVNLIERIKFEVIQHIESSAYLKKLIREMNISRKAARAHQQARINNIKNLHFDLQHSTKISWDNNFNGAYAYYIKGSGDIVLPFDIDLKDPEERKFFYESVLHEILHESTLSTKGMSDKSYSYLSYSFKPESDAEEKEDIDYYSKPTELIVRKQILDLEMEKLGIKKYGKEFTEEHYKKLLELKEKGELSPNVIQLLDHIKPELFVIIMNELASLDDNGKKYFHPAWDYNEGKEDSKA